MKEEEQPPSQHKRDGSFRFSGRFETARGAAYEYDKMARFEFGAAATLNFPDDGTGLAANEEEVLPTATPTADVAGNPLTVVGVGDEAAAPAPAAAAGGGGAGRKQRKPRTPAPPAYLGEGEGAAIAPKRAPAAPDPAPAGDAGNAGDDDGGGDDGGDDGGDGGGGGRISQHLPPPPHHTQG